MEEIPRRRYPAHHAPLERGNQSILVFVTLCAKDRKPCLANDVMHANLLAAWEAASFWKVGRYVIMPDHVHLFCAPGTYPPHPLRRWVGFWKNAVARQYSEGVLWQRDLWDRQLRSGDSYSEKWNYVRNNPVRAGLVNEADAWAFQGELNPLWWHDV